jgi:hypothetical protein
MSAQNSDGYYMKMKSLLMSRIEKDRAHFEKLLIQHLPKPKTEQLLNEARTEFENLLPKLPYIGNETNVLAGGFISAAWCLGFFRSLEREGLTLHEIAKMMYEKMEHDAESKSPDKKRNLKEFYFSPAMRAAEVERSRESLSRKYPGDWVSEYVEGDGKNFDFGINFTECAIHKFFKQHDALRYTPIFCLSDYATYRAFGIGFKRTQNIVLGASTCEFRFKKDWETPRGWPPEDLEEGISF